jgi:uncharacterized protein YkwD
MNPTDTPHRHTAAPSRPSRRRALICAITAAGLVLSAPVASAGAQARHHHNSHHIKSHHAKAHETKLHRRHRVIRPNPIRPVLSPRVAGPLAACANADASAASASVAVMDATVSCLINQQRVEHGLFALSVSSRLTGSAQSWNNGMVASGDFTHGSNFAGRISAVGYDWQTAGENIATGYGTPRSVVNAWMASPDHCQNILNPSFRDMGTAETAAPVGTWATGPATWTQDFGLLMTQAPLSGNHTPQNGCPYS